MFFTFLLCAVAAFFCWRFYARHARQRRALIAEIDEVRGRFEEPGMRLLRLLESLERDLVLIRGGHVAEEAAEIIGDDEVLREAEELASRHAELTKELSEHGHSHSRRDLREREESWRELAEAVGDFLPRLQAEEARLAAVIARTGRLPTRVQDAERLMGEVEAAGAAGEERGFVVHGELTVLSDAAERLREIRSLVDGRRLVASEEPLTTLLGDLSGAKAALRTLEQRWEALSEREAVLRGALERLHRQRDEAEAVHRTLVADFAHEIGQDMGARMAAGASELTAAERHLDVLAAELNSADVHGGEAAAEAAEAAQERAEEAFAAPAERRDRVRELSRTLPGYRRSGIEHAGRIEAQAQEPEETRPLAPVAVLLREQMERLDMSSEKPAWLTLELRVAEVGASLNQLESAVQEVAQAVRSTRAALNDAHRKLWAARRAPDTDRTAERIAEGVTSAVRAAAKRPAP